MPAHNANKRMQARARQRRRSAYKVTQLIECLIGWIGFSQLNAAKAAAVQPKFLRHFPYAQLGIAARKTEHARGKVSSRHSTEFKRVCVYVITMCCNTGQLHWDIATGSTVHNSRVLNTTLPGCGRLHHGEKIADRLRAVIITWRYCRLVSNSVTFRRKQNSVRQIVRFYLQIKADKLR